MFTSETFGCNWLVELNKDEIVAEFLTQDGAVMLRLIYSDTSEIKLDDWDYSLLHLVRSKLNNQNIFKLKLDEDGERKRYTIVKHPEREECLEKVKQNRNEFFYISDELRNDREIVLAAVRQKWKCIGICF